MIYRKTTDLLVVGLLGSVSLDDERLLIGHARVSEIPLPAGQTPGGHRSIQAALHPQGVLNEEKLSGTVTEITGAIAIESQQASWSDLVKDDEVRSRRRVVLACVLNSCQAWPGSTPVSYYTTYM